MRYYTAKVLFLLWPLVSSVFVLQSVAVIIHVDRNEGKLFQMLARLSWKHTIMRDYFQVQLLTTACTESVRAPSRTAGGGRRG